LKRGNSTRKAGLIHRIHIHPDESADKGSHQQPAILPDPFLPGHRSFALPVKKLAVRFLFRSQFLNRILLRRAWRLIEPEIEAVQYHAQDHQP
jgi:hypothetical protein